MVLQEIGSGHGPDSSGSEQGQVAGSCECSSERRQVPQNAGTFLTR